MKHICSSCGRLIDTEDWAEHTRTCNVKRDPGMLPGKPPKVPNPIQGCRCEFCIGITICPICKQKTLYLDKKAGYWKCVKCNHYYHVDINSIKHDKNIPIIDNTTQDLSQQETAQERLKFWNENLKNK